MNESLQTTLRKLRLSGLAQSLEVRLQEAAGHGLNHTEFLELILQDELAVRADRLMGRRVQAAAFRESKTLEDFDFAFNPSVNRKQVFDLAAGRFIREARDVLLLGPPGTGKSHLVQALGYQAIKGGFTVLYRSIFDVVRDFLHDEALGGEEKVLNRYLKPDLVIIDDMGMKQLPKSGVHRLLKWKSRAGRSLFDVSFAAHDASGLDPSDPTLVANGIDGNGHEFFVDPANGFTFGQQKDLVAFLLALHHNAGRCSQWLPTLFKRICAVARGDEPA